MRPESKRKHPHTQKCETLVNFWKLRDAIRDKTRSREDFVPLETTIFAGDGFLDFR